jgi:hypothetical protein
MTGAGRALTHRGLSALQPCKTSKPSRGALRGRKCVLRIFLGVVYIFQCYVLLGDTYTPAVTPAKRAAQTAVVTRFFPSTTTA